MIFISSDFEAGNILVLSASSPGDIRVEIETDSNATSYQWFYFRLDGAEGEPCRISIENAGDAYAGGWDDYQAVASYDQKSWRRVPTCYEDGRLIISMTPECGQVFIAFFAPYPLQREAALSKLVTASADTQREVLGRSVDGADIELLNLQSRRADALKFWITARQHPGETMGSWWLEGLVHRLLDELDEQAVRLRELADIFIIPNMNPDGCLRGNLRANAAGEDLNLAWPEATLLRSPEAYYVRNRLFQTGADLVLDAHGTETLSHVFLVGPEGPAGHRDPIRGIVDSFKDALKRANRDFQTEFGYPTPDPLKANLSITSNYLGETLGCPCVTLEMPFKDSMHNPDPNEGWSPARCQQLGHDTVAALLDIAPELKRVREAWCAPQNKQSYCGQQ
ncbi:hypothetical protein GCM10007385_01080 [Tateyamaria omphalii]|uniref:M14 family metallopeptidase n=1 Tax=Tateyamaria omphalii TaxID=299262 RepID=UPI0019936A7A|nr:M14-type cytosolic carboxypeptidase [Tateyamaria omphalii]GGX38090.1 hypothetical protein GCM10007385_01080 [Tateyamaria omphalii]